MAYFFENLDLRTREYMLREIELDAASGTLYLSPRLRPESEQQYVSSLRDAARAHSEHWMAEQIRARRLLRSEEERTSLNGGTVTLRVPLTACDSLAEDEFNRFYARAICARAVDIGLPHVEVYRAKAVSMLRPESESIIGTRLAADALLARLRKANRVEHALGLTEVARTGVTVRLVW
ncbi:MAG: hypothetical protein WC538_17800 [Thermoanaerobaculia bacterium]|jgi:hypothetical protein